MGTTRPWMLAMAACCVVASACSVDRIFAPADGGGGGNGASGGEGAGPSNGGSGGNITEGGGGTLPSCGEGSVCIPPAPVGWQGPLVVYEGPNGTPPPECGPGYPTSLGDYFTDLDTGSHACDCECEGADDIECTTPVSICFDNGSQCIAACFGFTITVEPGIACATAVNNSNSTAHVGNPPPTDMGFCVPNNNHDITPPVFTTAARVCGGAESTPEGCQDDALCVPQPEGDFNVVCIAQPGDDVPCLDPFYSEQHVLAEDFSDGRQCSTCTCGAATSTCGGNVTFANSSCTIATASLNAGDCGPNPDNSSFVSYSPVGSGTCPPSDSTPSGEVTLTTALTLCCNR